LERPDQELIKGYLAGNAEDFEVLYERYKRQVYSYLNKMLQSQSHTADDLFQQVWIKALDKLHVYKNKDRFLGWILRIAHNMAIDHFRRGRKHLNNLELDREEAPEISEAPGKEPWRGMDRAELDVIIGKALETLPDEQKEVFLMRQEKISFKDIAEIQQCSINTALARMQYAVKNLRKELSELHIGGIR
jgi:RNA polymerase sigma-70 factor (ECF subfamily)